jgi:hypothetical protein
VVKWKDKNKINNFILIQPNKMRIVRLLSTIYLTYLFFDPATPTALVVKIINK